MSHARISCEIRRSTSRRRSARIALRAAVVLIFAGNASAGEELPKSGPNESFDIEPPLLVQPIPAAEPRARMESAPQLSVALERARQSASGSGRLYRAGIISKVEMEQRALKVVRLESDLAVAEFARAQEELSATRAAFEAKQISSEEVTRASDAAHLAETAAKDAMARKQQAELDAAKMNLERQQKLLAAGSARSSDVHRAEEKLASLVAQTQSRITLP